MTTPRRVKLNQNILFIVEDDVIVIICHNHRDRTILLLWDRLRLDTRLDFSSEIVSHEYANFFFGDLLGLVKRKLLVLDGFLDGKCRPGADFQVQVSSVCAKGFCVNGSKLKFTLVLLGERL